MTVAADDPDLHLLYPEWTYREVDGRLWPTLPRGPHDGTAYQVSHRVGLPSVEELLSAWSMFKRRAIPRPHNLYEGQEVRFVRWIRCSINGTLGTVEDFTHTLSLTLHSGTAMTEIPITNDEIVRVAALVRDAWRTFWTTGPASAGVDVPGSFFPTGVTYRDVTATLLEQTAPTSNTDPAAGATTTLVPTAGVLFEPALSGTSSGNSLPYEVACALTLRSRDRGPRYRGRLYMPPMHTGTLTSAGLFNPAIPQAIARGFGQSVVAALRSTSDYQVTVISRRGLTGREVVGVDAGQVPDSQRRRRRRLVEAHASGWPASA